MATLDTQDATMADFQLGQHVELHPATDRWMMGDRYGTIIRVSLIFDRVTLRMDKSGRKLSFRPANILKGPQL